MTIGIREVALRAGVSAATVSNVINRPGRVSSETAVRVESVMAELGYVPNVLASQLRTGKRTTIGMVLLSVANPFFAELADACEIAAEEAGYAVIFGSSGQSASREGRYMELFERQRVAGLLVVAVGGETEAMRALRKRGTPVVLFDEGDHGDLPTVELDGKTGGYKAVTHLIESGRNRLAFLGGPIGLVEHRWIGALRAAAEARGVELRHIDTPDTSLESGRAAGEILEAMNPAERPDGVFAANDLLALGLQQALLVSGKIRMPDDLAIVGYDDIPFAATASVPLTTIKQPVGELARHAVRLVATGAARTERVILNPELIVRQSTARAR